MYNHRAEVESVAVVCHRRRRAADQRSGADQPVVPSQPAVGYIRDHLRLRFRLHVPPAARGDEEAAAGRGGIHRRMAGAYRLGLLHRLRAGQTGQWLPGRPRQRAPVLRRHGADVGADQPGHAGLRLAVELGDPVGAERVVPGRRVALQRGLAGQLVQRPGTRALLRHLQQFPFAGRGADVCVQLAARRQPGLAGGFRRPGDVLHPGRVRHPAAAPRPARNDGPAPGRRVAQRSSDPGGEHRRAGSRGRAEPVPGAADAGHVGARIGQRLHVCQPLRHQQLGHALSAGTPALHAWSRRA